MTVGRRPSRRIMVGSVPVGGGAPVTVQSMLNVRTSDVEAAARQLESLRRAGAEIVRLAVDSDADVAALRKLVKTTPLPLVADIQFNREAAVAAVEAGAAAIRVNPGLFPVDGGEFDRLAAILAERGTAIRVGANSGSIGSAALKAELAKGGDRASALARALAERTLRQCEALEKRGVYHIKAALKASDVRTTVAANRLAAATADYPLHMPIRISTFPPCRRICTQLPMTNRSG